MRDDQHPDGEALAAYLESPAAARQRDVRRHLATCRACRAEVQGLWRLRRALRDDPAVLPRAGDDEPLGAGDERLVDEAVRGGLDAAGHRRLDAEPRLLREALHRCLDAHPALPAAGGTGAGSRAGRWLRALFAWRLPVWAATGAAALLVVSVLALPGGRGWLTSHGPALVVYQDDPVLQFGRGDEPPGIGFFSNAQRSSEPFAGAGLSWDGQVLTMRWPAVAGANAYTVQLYAVERDRQTAVARAAARQPAVRFDGLALTPGRRYVWVIEGRTADERRFATSGGFVLGNPDQ